MKKLFGLTLILLLFFNLTSPIFAENPTAIPNNIFGIHITGEEDLENAARLVNSTGGDWGYVTFVITEKERDTNRWQKTFDRMRRLHLIPIVRIATKPEGDIWTIPKEGEIENWVNFLNSLNWVIQNRYIVVGNEPNHSKEWGGKIDPEGYATYLKTFSNKLKSASPDYFILQAGLDASAPNSNSTMDEALYIKRMVTAIPDVFNNIDGWSSHSYPNPAFSGSELDRGKGTITTYIWELNYLKSLNITKDFPVFITETGWSSKNLSETEIAEKLTFAYKNVWNDPKVVAVTPFILNYTQFPFAEFSWQKNDGKFYSFYETVSKLPKIKGKPVQKVSGQIVLAIAQPIIFLGNKHITAILAKNTGQSIWDLSNTVVDFDSTDTTIETFGFKEIEPNKTGLITFNSFSTENVGLYSKSVYLKDTGGRRITNSFPLEAVVVKVDQNQIFTFFAKIEEYISSIFKLNLQ